MKRLAIYGASGHGKVVADMAEQCGWSGIEFFDDAWPEVQNNCSWKIVGDTITLLQQVESFDGVIVAIGDNKIRYEKLKELKEKKVRLKTLVHPAATISQYASLGSGSVVMAGVVVNAGALIGVGAILNTCCSVDHDCLVGDSVHISPGARLAGGVRVGDKSWIGIGANVRQGLHIGSNVMVGAGAAVVCNLPDGVTALGVPARIKSNF